MRNNNNNSDNICKSKKINYICNMKEEKLNITDALIKAETNKLYEIINTLKNINEQLEEEILDNVNTINQIKKIIQNRLNT